MLTLLLIFVFVMAAFLVMYERLEDIEQSQAYIEERFVSVLGATDRAHVRIDGLEQASIASPHAETLTLR